MTLTIRSEIPSDAEAISHLTEAGFRDAPHSSHTEQFIVDALRRHGQLTVSLVSIDAGALVGHVAISPVTLSSGDPGWFGLGPISVMPTHQGRRVGSALMQQALAELRRLGGHGCVLLGDPAFYSCFGLQPEPRLVLPGVPREYLQALSFTGVMPAGTVNYHEAFNATASTQ